MSFLEEYNALDQQQTQVELVGHWLAQNPAALFAELRERRPIFPSPQLTIVTKYDDVLEVLRRDDVFSIRLYTPKMERVAPTGFLLGMPDSARYQKDAALLHLAMRRDDLPRLRRFVAQTAHQIVRSAASRRRLDVVQELAYIVPLRFIEHYFGVPVSSAPQLAAWVQAIFQDMFLNADDDPTDPVGNPARQGALRAASELRPYLDGLINHREERLRAGNAGPDDVLGRLLRMRCQVAASFSRAQIRDNLIGLMVGAVDTTATAITNVVDELLRRPHELHDAHQAACRGDDELLMSCIHEALRFKPQAPALVRFCERRHTLAAATQHAVTIEPGAAVFAATASAMFDPERIEAPNVFRPGRPVATDYLHFGHGLHTCLGRYAAQVQIFESIKRLLRVEGLRRLKGAAGNLSYRGPFPQSMVVEFDSVHCSAL